MPFFLSDPRIAHPNIWRRMGWFLQIFGRDRRGAAAVETALVAVPFLASLAAALQLGLIYLCQSALEVATDKTARSVLTGSYQSSGMTQQQFLSALCGNLPAMLSCAKIMVDAQVYSSFSSSTMTAPAISYDYSGHVTNQWSYNIGGANNIVVIRVMYLLPAIGALGFNVTNQGANKHLIMSTTVLKTEPFR